LDTAGSGISLATMIFSRKTPLLGGSEVNSLAGFLVGAMTFSYEF